jgi:hypothetical protein
MFYQTACKANARVETIFVKNPSAQQHLNPMWGFKSHAGNFVDEFDD